MGATASPVRDVATKFYEFVMPTKKRTTARAARPAVKCLRIGVYPAIGIGLATHPGRVGGSKAALEQASAPVKPSAPESGKVQLAEAPDEESVALGTVIAHDINSGLALGGVYDLANSQDGRAFGES